MAAPIGNQNASKARMFADALRRALARDGGDLARGLDKIADRLVAAAVAGHQWAIADIADRLDGRPKQTIEGQIDHNVNVGSSDSLAPAISRALEVRTKPSVQ